MSLKFVEMSVVVRDAPAAGGAQQFRSSQQFFPRRPGASGGYLGGVDRAPTGKVDRVDTPFPEQRT